MEIPKSPLNEINEDLYQLAVESAFEEYKEDHDEIIAANMEYFHSKKISLYDQARFVAFWLYGENRIDQVFTDDFLQKLKSENEISIEKTQSRLSDSKDERERRLLQINLDKFRKKEKFLMSKEFILESSVEIFLKQVGEYFLRNKSNNQSEEEALREYMRVRIAMRRKTGINLQPDDKTEQTNYPYEEGHNF
jgi:hypothetical protein